jgi:hypothetical protein
VVDTQHGAVFERQSLFRGTTLSPSSGSKKEFDTWYRLISCQVLSSALKMEAKYSYETSVDFQRTALQYVPEDGNLSEAVMCRKHS